MIELAIAATAALTLQTSSELKAFCEGAVEAGTKMDCACLVEKVGDDADVIAEILSLTSKEEVATKSEKTQAALKACAPKE